MLDDDKERRHDAGSAHGHELSVTMRAPRPSVPVVVKRRRLALPLAEGTASRATPTPADRAPRVFRVEGEPMAAPAAPLAAADAPSPTRRRTSADPTRRPGEVTRIVFEVPEPEPPTPAFVPAGYAEVQASLERVRAELDRARLARRFRVG